MFVDCNCSEAGGEDGSCDVQSGACNCKANVEGVKCDQCQHGYFNLQPGNGFGCEGMHIAHIPVVACSFMLLWHCLLVQIACVTPLGLCHSSAMRLAPVSARAMQEVRNVTVVYQVSHSSTPLILTYVKVFA